MVVVLQCDKLNRKSLRFGLLFFFPLNNVASGFRNLSLVNPLPPGLNSVNLLLLLAFLLLTIDTKGFALPHPDK